MTPLPPSEFAYAPTSAPTIAGLGRPQDGSHGVLVPDDPVLLTPEAMTWVESEGRWLGDYHDGYAPAENLTIVGPVTGALSFGSTEACVAPAQSMFAAGCRLEVNYYSDATRTAGANQLDVSVDLYEFNNSDGAHTFVERLAQHTHSLASQMIVTRKQFATVSLARFAGFLIPSFTIGGASTWTIRRQHLRWRWVGTP